MTDLQSPGLGSDFESEPRTRVYRQFGTQSDDEPRPSREHAVLKHPDITVPDGPKRLDHAAAASLAALRRSQPSSVPLAQLTHAWSPRSEGVDEAHVARLTEVDGELPPILVHRNTMRIIDGCHRVEAARRNGAATLQAYLFDGSSDAAFELAVHANVFHGLPLTLSDRRDAAAKILRAHPEWSDRAVAATTGLSSSAVRGVRCATDDLAQSHRRIGRDGRFRPLDVAQGRRVAAELINARPHASLREIATASGVSPGTVRDVRARIARGEDPVPAQRKRRSKAADRALSIPAAARVESGDIGPLLQALSNDPALRMSTAGRNLLRWLHIHAVNSTDYERITEYVPDHCVEQLIEVANRCSANWSRIARELDTESRSYPPSSATKTPSPRPMQPVS